MDNSAETAPLLNEYKLEYFSKRFPQTILGGLQLRPGVKLPWRIHLGQLMSFLLPLLISALMTTFAELNVKLQVILTFVFGGLMFSIVFLIHIALLIAEKRTSEKELDISSSVSEIGLESLAALKSMRYIFRRKHCASNVVTHSIVYGTVCGLSFYYLLPSKIKLIYGSTAASIVYYVFGWFTVCVGQYSLISQAPPEPAQFRTTDQLELSPLSRPFYVGCFAVIGIIATFEQKLKSPDYILRIIFACLPIIWTLGILPPLDSLYSWLGDQILVHIFGGSPMANDRRLFVMLLISAISFGIVYPLPSTTALLAVAASLGLITSIDLCSFLERIYHYLRGSSGRVKDEEKSQSWSVYKFLHFLLMLVSVAAIVAVVDYVLTSTKKSDLLDIFGYLLIACLVVFQSLGKISSIYIFFGLIRNPIYKQMARSHVRRIIGLIRKLFINSVLPLLLVTFVALGGSSKTTLPSLAVTITACRAFRWAWQETSQCLIDAVIVMIIKFSTVKVGTWWTNMDLHLQLLLMTLIRSRVQYLWSCVSFCIRFIVKFYFSRKIRHKSYKTVGLLNIALLPIWLSLFFISVALYAPILPLFTLPFFLMGYPRPRRFWPLADIRITSSSSDWIYYEQLTYPLTNRLKDIIATGSLGEVSAGDYFLARFQDRLIWVSVLERGYMHTNIVVKGLELAETSCHTAEAARIDDIFESVTKENPRPIFNPYPLHVLRPCDFVDLNTYSDAKNVLTGIIDRPENLNSLKNHFITSLIWVLLRYSKLRRDKGLGDGPTMDEIQQRHEQMKKNNSFRILLTNETRNTLVLNPGEETIVRKKSPSLNSKSSASENSMNALWSSRTESTVEPIKMIPLKDHGGIQSNQGTNGMPALSTNSKRPKESMNKFGIDFRGPNLVMDDDFDEFGFDELDESLPRTNSLNGIENDDESENFSYKRKLPVVENDDDSIFTTNQMKTGKIPKPKSLPSLVADFSSPHSSQLEPPLRWKDSIPVESSIVSSYEALFPEEWFKYVLSCMGLGTKGERVLESISSDRGLLFIFRKLALSCFFAVYEQQQFGALDVWKIFNGELPWSQYSYWLEQDTELRNHVLISYRYAFKLMYDEAVLGAAEDFEELAETLVDFEDNWYMGSDQDSAWIDAVRNNVPKLLSIGRDKENAVFTSRVLTKQNLTVPIGKIDSENVRAIWSSLSLELYYFTNDDEERYSIQAHPSHLRNITIQAADPPLGYPVFSSGLRSIVAW